MKLSSVVDDDVFNRIIGHTSVVGILWNRTVSIALQLSYSPLARFKNIQTNC